MDHHSGWQSDLGLHGFLVPALSGFDYTVRFKIEQADCLFQCVRQYLSVMITEGNVLSITCPDALCKKQGKMEAAEVRKIVHVILKVMLCWHIYSNILLSDFNIWNNA